MMMVIILIMIITILLTISLTTLLTISLVALRTISLRISYHYRLLADELNIEELRQSVEQENIQALRHRQQQNDNTAASKNEGDRAEKKRCEICCVYVDFSTIR
jgi:biopolymer transport protein ExbB/TolQ